MKHKLLYLILAIVVVGTPAVALAQQGLDCSSGTCLYTPLEPIPGVEGQSGNVDLATLMRTVFRVLFSLSALLAVGMLVAGGIQYMVSEVPGVKVTALARAQAAVYGILILAGSWLILNTINPQLLEFKFDLKSSAPTPAVKSPSSASDLAGGSTGLTVGVVRVYGGPDTPEERAAIDRLLEGCKALSGKVENVGGTDSGGTYTDFFCKKNRDVAPGRGSTSADGETDAEFTASETIIASEKVYGSLSSYEQNRIGQNFITDCSAKGGAPESLVGTDANGSYTEWHCIEK